MMKMPDANIARNFVISPAFVAKVAIAQEIPSSCMV
jgi:hypothetical protein